MRTYEALFIVQPNVSDEEIQTVAQGVERLVTGDGGAIVRTEIWGKRRLAYEIEKFIEGIYILIRFQANPALIRKLNSHFRLHDDIIRAQVIYFDETTLRLEQEQERRNQAQLAARSNREEDDEDDDEEERPRRRGRDRDREEAGAR